jgi:2-C-methyl-D-erythritol 4-phosphate cytidylyltransferase
MDFSKSVIIAGGGSGNRMGSTIPKQFLLLQGKPVLMHTIQHFFDYDHKIEVIVILPSSQIIYWKMLCEEHNFTLPHVVAEGGATRFYSVKKGLDILKTNGLTAVHDAVRPLVSIEIIAECYKTATEHNSAVPVIELVDSLRFISNNENSGCKRKSYCAVQTPQVFKTLLLKKGYEQPYSDLFTDDASVMEALGEKIALVKGDMENIKITTHVDLLVAEAIMQQVNK